jgi:hypothetical protein
MIKSLLLSGILLASTAAAETPAWRYLDPGAKALMGFNMAIARKAGLKPSDQKAEALDSDGPGGLSNLGRKYSFLGNSAESLVMALPEQMGVVTGKFVETAIRDGATQHGLKEQKLGSAALFVNEAKPAESIVYVDSTTVLVGEPKAMQAALGRVGSNKTPPPLWMRGQKLAGHHMIWVASDQFDEEVKKAMPLPQEAGMNPARFEGVKAADIGMNMAKGIAMKMDLHFETDAQAKKAIEELKPPKDMPQDIAKVTAQLDRADQRHLIAEVSLDFEKLFKTMGDALQKGFADSPEPARKKQRVGK